MARAGSLAKLVQQGTNVFARSAAGPAAQLASEATSSCSSRASAVLINVQRREGSSLTTTSHDSVSAVTKSLLLDTLGLMRRFEKIGLTRAQSEQMTEMLTEVVCTNKEKISQQFVTKQALEKAILEQESRIAGFKGEVAKSQELHLASLSRDTERLTNSLEKMRAEIKYEVDKLSASQRLDLNLEKGRMRDELQALRDKSNEMEIKMDRETNALKAAVEQSKNEVLRYSLSMILALMAAGLTAARVLQK
ncbi:probable mitochondrial calcium uniporter regulator 1 [Coccomyxa sp. Obi]|nr:probable mitochondrial calcium uniporter regulator 1 [Coccomyxa sp. Obi]